MNTEVMFSSKSDDWSTPNEFYQDKHRIFDFNIDGAANAENRKCPRWFGPGSPLGEDALTIDWHLFGDRVWVNPPYSMCREFVAKAAEQQRRGVLTVMLVPSRTDTRWWHDHVWDRKCHEPRPGVRIEFVKGRIKFGGAKAGAPFPSVVIVFNPITEL